MQQSNRSDDHSLKSNKIFLKPDMTAQAGLISDNLPSGQIFEGLSWRGPMKRELQIHQPYRSIHSSQADLHKILRSDKACAFHGRLVRYWLCAEGVNLVVHFSMSFLFLQNPRKCLYLSIFEFIFFDYVSFRNLSLGQGLLLSNFEIKKSIFSRCTSLPRK